MMHSPQRKELHVECRRNYVRHVLAEAGDRLGYVYDRGLLEHHYRARRRERGAVLTTRPSAPMLKFKPRWKKKAGKGVHYGDGGCSRNQLSTREDSTGFASLAIQ
jgi:hypothetical protein